MMKFYRELNSCRICGGVFYLESIKLQDSPLANELYNSRNEALDADVFPLEVVMCESCKHIQLKHIVDPTRLFSDYVYASGTSRTFQDHFETLAKKISSLAPRGTVLEIGSNDGTLLNALTKKGLRAVGVEPSKVLTEMSQGKCEAVFTDFLNKDLASKLKEKYIEFDVVVGNNVFAHIDDLPEALYLVQSLLKDNGLFIFEVAHSLQMVNDLLFDTIYHEHMSYHSVTSLSNIMNKIGFSILDVEEIDMHGGSIRVICQKNHLQQPYSKSVQDIVAREMHAKLDSAAWMTNFRLRLIELKEETKKAINIEPLNTLWFGYGAPAKAVTFINEFGLDTFPLMGIVDDNPGKQGKFLPKSGFGIISKEQMSNLLDSDLPKESVRCVIFPWNLSTEITSKLDNFVKYGVKLIWFLPRYKKVEFI